MGIRCTQGTHHSTSAPDGVGGCKILGQDETGDTAVGTEVT